MRFLQTFAFFNDSQGSKHTTVIVGFGGDNADSVRTRFLPFQQTEDGALFERPIRVFLSPPKHTRYGIAEVDESEGLDEGHSVEGLRWLIRHFSTEGVISVFCGEGRACIAALLEGRPCVAVEPRNELRSAACDRITDFFSAIEGPQAEEHMDEEVPLATGSLGKQIVC
jgi:hypothetical protein